MSIRVLALRYDSSVSRTCSDQCLSTRGRISLLLTRAAPTTAANTKDFRIRSSSRCARSRRSLSDRQPNTAMAKSIARSPGSVRTLCPVRIQTERGRAGVSTTANTFPSLTPSCAHTSPVIRQNRSSRDRRSNMLFLSSVGIFPSFRLKDLSFVVDADKQCAEGIRKPLHTLRLELLGDLIVVDSHFFERSKRSFRF